MKNILITGAAGFIGANLVMKLLREGLRRFAEWYKEFYKI